MQTFKTAKEILEHTQKLRQKGKTIGFVPTMGALHDGHLSLVKKAREANDFAVCSIFVNPTQFNESADFENYPRTLESDLNKLKSADCDIAFIPSTAEIFPERDKSQYYIGEVASVLEGAHRPGHFNGVASVVKRLLELVKPHRAYFGLKDYQQYVVIKSLVEAYNIDVEIEGCEIVRETSGLAMSSRNGRLSSEGMDNASVLYKALLIAQQSMKDGKSVADAENDARTYLKAAPVELEYFEIRNRGNLSKPSINRNGLIALVAARVEGVRLIDNLFMESE